MQNNYIEIRKPNVAKRIVLIIVSSLIMMCVLTTNISAAARQLVFKSGTWSVYMDSPDSAKPYYHLHFYSGNNNIYCLRLDNMQPCDGTAKNKEKVPKKVRENVMKVAKVKNAVTYHKPVIKNNWVRVIVKPLALAGAGVLVVLAAVNIFAGPIDDIAAWSALVAIAGW